MERFDYVGEDTGNFVLLEHVNLTIPDQHLATAFYVSGLGLTRDPYMMVGVTNMWINVGRSQIHLPRGEAQRLRGRVALIVGERAALVRRLQGVQPLLDRTEFGWAEHADRVEVTCPWGNRYDCLDPQTIDASARWSRIELGIAYLRLDVPAGSAGSIAAFYRDVFGAPAHVRDSDGLQHAVIDIGTHQQLVFAETRAAIPDYDGHHMQLYTANFSGPYRWLAERGLTYGEERHQYRFADLIDPTSGARCFTIEHEIRSLQHPLYGRPLVNRNAQQSVRDYRRGHDGRSGAF